MKAGVELNEGINLFDLCYSQGFYKLSAKIKLDIAMLPQIMAAVLEAISFLHQMKGILHRDITIQNIIINFNKSPPSASFSNSDSACLIQQSTCDFTGSFGYQGPTRYLDNDKRSIYSLSDDYFSIGIVLAELLSTNNYQAFLAYVLKKDNAKLFRPKFNHEMVVEAFSDIYGNETKPLLNPIVYKIIRFLLNPNKRPTFIDVFNMIHVLKDPNITDPEYIFNADFSLSMGSTYDEYHSRNLYLPSSSYPPQKQQVPKRSPWDFEGKHPATISVSYPNKPRGPKQHHS